MRCKHFSRFVGIFAALVIMFAVCFGGIEAAADVVTKSFTPLEFYDMIGDTIDFTYYNGSSYVDTSASFSHSGTIQTLNSSGNYVSGIPCLFYYTDIVDDINTNRNYDTVTVHPNFYFQNISSLSFSIYCSTGVAPQYSNVVSSSTYRSPSVDFFVDGSRIHQSYTWVTNGGWTPFVPSSDDNSNINFKYLQAAYTWSAESEAALITLGDVHFNGVDDSYDRICFAITVPTISEDATLTAGQYVDPNSGSGSGGQTIINNNVDLTETHSILGGISNFLSDIWEAIRGIPGSILEGIEGIFVPSDEFMEEFEDEIEDIRDRFAWVEDLKEIGAHLVDITENRESVTAPVVVIPRITNSKDGTVYTESGEKVLDLAEYETEILTVRVILTALLWVFFLWRLYARLPDIIHGGGMIIGDGTRIMNELDERQSQALFNDIETHANSIFQGTMPDITYIDHPDKVDWKV